MWQTSTIVLRGCYVKENVSRSPGWSLINPSGVGTATTNLSRLSTLLHDVKLTRGSEPFQIDCCVSICPFQKATQSSWNPALLPLSLASVACCGDTNELTEADFRLFGEGRQLEVRTILKGSRFTHVSDRLLRLARSSSITHACNIQYQRSRFSLETGCAFTDARRRPCGRCGRVRQGSSRRA